MENAFAGMTAPEYDSWRESAEFFEVESTIVSPFLAQRKAKRVLDLGCGTGTWTRKTATILPASEVLGVDISSPMINYAQQRSGHGIQYLVRDCCRATLATGFDLIVCAMSADYIGFDCLRRTIESTLDDDGVALWWVLDPSRYELRAGRRFKKWTVNGRTIEASAAEFDSQRVSRRFAEAHLHNNFDWFDVSLSDGKSRRLLISTVTWDHRR
jgi:SAM-dependent methyltransferase